MTWPHWLLVLTLLLASHAVAIWFAVQFASRHAYWLGREDAETERMERVTRRFRELTKGSP